MISYERFIQWAAGPNSAIVGFLVMRLANAKFLGSPHIGKAAVAHAIFDVGTFLGAAAATYAAHHKWLGNVAKWWKHVEQQAEPLPASLGPEVPPPNLVRRPQSARTPDSEVT